MIVIFCFLSLEESFIDEGGRTLFFWATGVMVFGMVVVISNMKVFVISHNLSIASGFFIIMSILLFGFTWVIEQSILTQQIQIYRTFDP
jgi:hypothetical protein